MFEYRKKLEPLLNQRHTFTGIFEKFGIKDTKVGKLLVTILMKDLYLSEKPNEILTDHLWFNFTKGFQTLDLKNGDIIEFNGTISTYQKGYSEDDVENPIREDYNLKFPRKVIKKGNNNNNPEIDKFNQDILMRVEKNNKERYESIKKYHENLKKEEDEDGILKKSDNFLEKWVSPLEEEVSLPEKCETCQKDLRIDEKNKFHDVILCSEHFEKAKEEEKKNSKQRLLTEWAS